MIVIIEGIDRVGKTTLSEMIEDRYRESIGLRRFRDDTRYAHGHWNKIVNSEKINTLQNLIEAGFIDNIILDRYHMTEFVYGAVDRHYKNNDMYDIDKRIAAVGKPDHPVSEPDDIDNIDSAMMVDNIYHTDVVLLYMVPVDVQISSEEHGMNLERHIKWYDDFYMNTSIENKIKIDYNTMDLALDFIEKILSHGDMEEPEDPVEPEPDEPIEGEEKEEDIETGETKTLESIIESSSFFNRVR